MVDCQYSAHAQINVAPNFEPMLSWCRPHPTLQAKSSCSNSCNECQIYYQAMTKNRPRLSLRSRLEHSVACWAGLSKRTSFAQEYVSMATLVCAHGITNLTNREPSERVEECILYALQVRTRTIKENCRSEKYFSLYIV